ncbi:hypothetical protein ABK040_002682 [Willaertia magna]
MAIDKNLVTEIHSCPNENEILIMVCNSSISSSHKGVYEYCLQIIQQNWIESLEVNAISYSPNQMLKSLDEDAIFLDKQDCTSNFYDFILDVAQDIIQDVHEFESKKEIFKINYQRKEQEALRLLLTNENYSNKSLSVVSIIHKSDYEQQHEEENEEDGMEEINPIDSVSNVVSEEEKQLRRSTGFIEIKSIGLILDKSNPSFWDKNSVEMLLTDENGVGIPKDLLLENNVQIYGLHFELAARAFLKEKSKREIENLLDDINPIVIRRALIAWIYQHLIEKP